MAKNNRASILMENYIDKYSKDYTLSTRQVKKLLNFNITQKPPYCGVNVEQTLLALHLLGIVLIDTRILRPAPEDTYCLASYVSDSEPSASALLRFACNRVEYEHLISQSRIAEIVHAKWNHHHLRPLCGENVDVAIERFNTLGLALVDYSDAYEPAMVYLVPGLKPWYQPKEKALD